MSSPPAPTTAKKSKPMGSPRALPRSAPADRTQDRSARAGKARTRAQPPSAVEARRATTEFGGRIFLSNDDSMSLAGAQRVLWAVANGVRLTSSEIRPHELLNYFTFEAPEISRGDTFGVAASAVKTDTGLALAVTITGAAPARRPLDLTVVLDRSGSMEGERMTLVKRGLDRMVGRLRAGDRVNVVLFDDNVDVVKEGFQVGRDDLDDLRLVFDEVQPDGSTNLDAALEAAYRVARAHDVEGRDARVLLLTDARITAGDLNPARVTDIGRAFDESRVRLAAIGVGDDVDDRVLQSLTEKGRGAYVYLGSEKVADRVFGAGFDSLVSVVADDVRFALDLPDSLGMSRFYGEEMSTAAADVAPVSFFAGSTQVFLQDLKVAEGGYAKSDPLVLDLSWRDPSTGKARTDRWEGTVGEALAADRSNVNKARALMAWTDVVRAGASGCADEKREWKARVRTYGGDVETRYLDELVADWCPAPRTDVIAEAQ
jgi:Ca-activated chloride channel family protein